MEVSLKHPHNSLSTLGTQPGLAIRILGNITRKRLKILCAADKIILEEIKKAGLYNDLWQSFAEGRKKL